MKHRTLEEYKEDVFDKLDDENKLNFIYTMSKQLCLIDETLKTKYSNKIKLEKINKIINGDDSE